MTTAQEVLAIAKKEVGYVEGKNNSNKYGQWYGMNGVAWCAQFVSWCLAQAGMVLPIETKNGFHYCPNGVSWFQRHGMWLGKVANPQPGDIVFFDWYPYDNKPEAWHVGFVELAPAGGSILTIEGNTSTTNQGNGGSVMRRERSMTLVLGFARPKYEASAKTETAVHSTVDINGKKQPAFLINGQTAVLLNSLPEYTGIKFDPKTKTSFFKKS